MRHLKYFKKTIVRASILSGYLDLGWKFGVFAPYFRACALFCYNSTIYTTYAIFVFCAILWPSDYFADFADFVDFRHHYRIIILFRHLSRCLELTGVGRKNPKILTGVVQGNACPSPLPTCFLCKKMTPTIACRR